MVHTRVAAVAERAARQALPRHVESGCRYRHEIRLSAAAVAMIAGRLKIRIAATAASVLSL